MVPRQRAALLHLAHDPLVDQIEELRHAREDGDLALGQRPHQLLRAERLEVDDTRAHRERQQQVGELRQRVEQRQHAQHAVVLGDVHHPERRVTLGDQVGVRQHHALRIRGGARGVENHGGRAAVQSPSGLRGRIGIGLTHRLGGRVHIEPQHLRQFGQRFGGRGRQALAGEQHAGAGVPEDRRDLRRRIVGVERHDDGAAGEDGEVGRAPMRVVVGEDGAAIAGLDAGRRQPRRSIQHERVQIAIGETIETVFTLDLHRHPIAHTADGVLEDAEQGRHARVTHYHGRVLEPRHRRPVTTGRRR